MASVPQFKAGQRVWFAEWHTEAWIEETVRGGGYWVRTQAGSRIFLLGEDLTALPAS
jgi:hypothetical protein